MNCNCFGNHKDDEEMFCISVHFYLNDGFTCVKEKFAKIYLNLDTILYVQTTFCRTVFITTSWVVT